MRSRVLANLGFLLQIAGILTILPIAVGLYFNETGAVDFTAFGVHRVSFMRVSYERVV